MKIYTDLEQIPQFKKPVITIGTFDGLHLGHIKIVEFLKSKAQEVKGESVVFTFHPHPRMVLHPDDHNLELIQTIDERVEKFRELGIDHLIVYPFSKSFSRLSATQFIRDILVNTLGLHTLVIGYDHHFGRNREGSMQNLKELAPLYGFEICEIAALIKEDTNISSTKIRKALQSGDLKSVYQFLGEFYKVTGTVVKGDRIGTKIGFPTANLKLEPYKLIPANGAYAVRVLIGQNIYYGMLNIGIRPTVAQDGEKRVEVNIFDFSGDIYEEEIQVEFIEYIRSEMSFDSVESLRQQLEKDEKDCRTIMHNHALV